MIDVARYISFLLWQHDCVVVPKIGAFIAHYQPATFDIARQVINPPCRLIGFNSEVSYDDGLLASAIAHFEHIGYDEAQAAIDNYSAALLGQLSQGRVVSIPMIGQLKKNRKSLTFEPTNSAIASSDLFGLDSYHIAERAQADETTDEPRKAVILPAIERAMRYAASVIVLLTLALLLTTPTRVDDNAVRASLQPTTVIQKAPAAKAQAIAPKATTLEASETTQSELAHDDDATYYLIVATFRSPKQVETFLAENSDHNLRVKPGKGMYKIYIASASNVEVLNAYSAANAIPDRYPGAWIDR